MSKATCDECNRKVDLNASGILVSHDTSESGPHCSGSGLYPLNPGGGDLHIGAMGGGLPTLGKGHR